MDLHALTGMTVTALAVLVYLVYGLTKRINALHETIATSNRKILGLLTRIESHLYIGFESERTAYHQKITDQMRYNDERLALLEKNLEDKQKEKGD